MGWNYYTKDKKNHEIFNHFQGSKLIITYAHRIQKKLHSRWKKCDFLSTLWSRKLASFYNAIVRIYDEKTGILSSFQI